MSDDAGATTGAMKSRQTVNGLAYVCAHLDEIRATLSADPTGQAGL